MSATPTGPEDILRGLSSWAQRDDPKIKESKRTREGHTYSVNPKHSDLLSPLFAKFSPSSKQFPHQYKDLRDALLQISKHLPELAADQHLSKDQEEELKNLQSIYAKVAREFEKERQGTSVENLTRASDLLEAYNTAFGLPAQLLEKIGVKRINASTTPPNAEQARKIEVAVAPSKKAIKQIKEMSIILADYQAIEDITKEISEIKEKRKGTKEGDLTREEISALVTKHSLSLEEAPLGKCIDLLYRHQFTGRLEIEKLVTQIAKWQNASEKPIKNVLKTVSFFKKLHIDLWMNIGGELYSFSELFGYNLRDPKTYNQSFTRDLVPKMKELILKKYGVTDYRQKVRDATGDKNAQVIIAGASSRLTAICTGKESIHTPFSIRGKQLTHEVTSAPEGVSPDSLSVRHPFTIFKTFGGYPPSLPKLPKDLRELPKLSPKEQQKASRGCQGALLGFIASFLNKHAFTILIKRLSPADIHSFIATAEETVLTKAESCEVLRKEIEKRHAELKERNVEPSPEEEKQIAQLKELEDYFKTPEAGTGSTVNLAGATRGSVSTMATRHEPSILATNDRKVMMCRNKDGTIAIHIFIGASAVNSIGIEKGSVEKKLADKVGSMAFGTGQEKSATGVKSEVDWIPENGEENCQPLPAPSRSIVARALEACMRVMARKSSAIHKTEEPEDKGITTEGEKKGFKLGGSTVMSIYLSKDYTLDPKLEEFNRVGSREMGGTPSESLEVKCNFAAIVASPLTYETLVLMQKLDPTSAGKTGSPLDKILQFRDLLKTAPDEIKNTALAQQWLKVFEHAKDNPKNEDELIKSVFDDDRYILENFMKRGFCKTHAIFWLAPENRVSFIKNMMHQKTLPRSAPNFKI